MAREGQQRDSKDGRGRGGRDRERDKDSDLIDKLVHINRQGWPPFRLRRPGGGR
jgi:hypothetical protein